MSAAPSGDYAPLMQVRRDAAWSTFDQAMNEFADAVRLKRIREQVIIEGRAEVRLFERAPTGGRPHPRLRMAFVAFDDPAPPNLPEPEQWADAAEFRRWLEAALGHPGMRAGLDQPPATDPHYWRNSLRAGRITALLDHAREAAARASGWSATERDAARYAIEELGALAYAGDIKFDDEYLGTYYSYLQDKPFVHVLEALLASLPDRDTPAFALLPTAQQQSVERQRAQLTNHLDFLMRHKYAFDGVEETSIEESVGGFLIDRKTRQLVSEDPATRDSALPRYQLLRIDPASSHAHAGAWIIRSSAGFALRDGTPLEVDPAELVSVEIPAEQLSFERAPNDSALRPGLRFDWNNDDLIDEQPIDWLYWAGHCDVTAVLEAIGLTMVDQAPVHEYRSDTGRVTELSRELLRELLAGVCEFGSVYSHMDGMGTIVRGISHFGGARHDRLPDRLQFEGADGDRHFRWPIGREADEFRFTRIREDGDDLDLDTVFSRCLPDHALVDFAPNPRHLRTIQGDYSSIDATGTQLSFSTRVSEFDAEGDLVQRDSQVELDLRPGAQGRTFLGSYVHDPVGRELYRLYLDRAQPAVVGQLWRAEQTDAGFIEVNDSQHDLVIPLQSPITTTLSREIRRDDPAMFWALLVLALRRGENICADTDMRDPVWNGVVTHMDVVRTAVNEAARVERWHVSFVARFGKAELDYMVRRMVNGTPKEYCATATDSDAETPDFLWQDLPDIGSKGVEQGEWVVNQAMRERGVVNVRKAPDEQGGWYVEDDYIKNSFELLYAALAGFEYTIIHQNKRYVFSNKAAWDAARQRLDALRAELSFD
jgi:hypothetical protein